MNKLINYGTDIRAAVKNEMKRAGVRNKDICNALNLCPSNFSLWINKKREFPRRYIEQVLTHLDLIIVKNM